MTIVMPVTAPPVSFADIEALWRSEPDVSYTQIAQHFDVSVTTIMEVIDLHIERTESAT
jgi:hypothetical protein